MQVSTHNQDTPAANKQHKIEDQLPEYFNHGRILKFHLGNLLPCPKAAPMIKKT